MASASSAPFTHSTEPRAAPGGKGGYRPMGAAPPAADPAADARVGYVGNQEQGPQKRKRPGRRPKTIYDLRPDKKSNVIPLEQYIIERKPEVEHAVAESQTDIFLPRPEEPPYVPKKTGIDAETQIESDLFDFDYEVAPMLSVIVDKTLEQALLEVEEEEELRAIRERKSEMDAKLEAEQARFREMEENEKKKMADMEARKREERDRMKKERTLIKKVTSSRFVRSLFSTLGETAVDKLTEAGHFKDPVREEIKTGFLSFLKKDVKRRIEDRKRADTLVNDLLDRAYHRKAQQLQKRELAKLAAAAAEAEAERNKNMLRIIIESDTVEGLTGEPTEIPIPKDATVEELEAAILKHLESKGHKVEAPPGGFLKMAKSDGDILQEGTTLSGAGVAAESVLKVAEK